MSDPSPPRKLKNREFSRSKAVVRLLLQWTFPAMFIAVTSCVLPIGPEFQDPPPVPNYQPYFVAYEPYGATNFTILSVPTAFEIDVSDPNTGDKLAVRWVANYPPYTPNATKLLAQSNPTPIPIPDPPDSLPILRVMSPVLTCDMFPVSTEKTLVAIVSDRDFLKDDVQFDPVTGQMLDRAHRYNYKNDGAPPNKGSSQSLVMVGWTIGGCQ